ncbi:outer membrane protein [Synechococcus sp. 1G10]|uniref:outer membrane protein n=1 Tax=Synechococcus sp. 1G10 TaxID=2025605 RepID=UPI00117FA75E|nr:hypothetical protein [Synechococcus sp. 1G10]
MRTASVVTACFLGLCYAPGHAAEASGSAKADSGAPLAGPSLEAEATAPNTNVVPGSEPRATPAGPAETTGETTPSLTQQQILQRIDILELELKMLRQAAGGGQAAPVVLLPKKGIYVQGDLGIQSRAFAGENGIVNLTFKPGFYGSLGLGYRYDRNFRFSFEYSSLDNRVDKIRPGIPIPVIDPVVGPVGADGAQFPSNGNVQLQSYVLNAYYDLNGFGYQKRFRPYLGVGVGLQTTTLRGVTPAFFPAIGSNSAANVSDTQPVINFQAGISYLANKQTEFYLGGKFSYAHVFLLENTDFGTLMPNGSRNWILSTGIRYTF